MSWEVRLMYGEKVADAPLHPMQGGTVIIGSRKCELNVTYNYSPIFHEHFESEGIYWLYGKKAGETAPVLKEIINDLRNFSPDKNYWKPTAGNVKKCLELLLEWAEIHPNAVWNILF